MSQNPSFLTSRSSGRRSGLAVARWYLPPFAGGCRGSGHPSGSAQYRPGAGGPWHARLVQPDDWAMTDGIDIWTRRASVVLLACCLETFLFAQAMLHFYPLGPVTRVAWEVVGYGVSVPATPWIWSLLFGFRVRLFGLGTPLAAVSHGAARLAVAAREDRDPTPLLGTLAVAFNLTWTAANDTLMLFLGSIPWLHLDDIIPVIAFSTTFFALSSVLRLQLLIVPNRWLRADISSRHIPHELGEEILHRDRKCFPQARMRRRLVRQGRYYAFLYSRRRPVVLTVLFLATGASAAWLLATSRTIFATLGVQMGAVLAGVPPLVATLALLRLIAASASPHPAEACRHGVGHRVRDTRM